jgi:hypothetical protein
MGELYRDRHHAERIVGLKVSPDVLARDPEGMVRFQREAGLVASLIHRFKPLESAIFPETKLESDGVLRQIARLEPAWNRREERNSC